MPRGAGESGAHQDPVGVSTVPGEVGFPGGEGAWRPGGGTDGGNGRGNPGRAYTGGVSSRQPGVHRSRRIAAVHPRTVTTSPVTWRESGLAAR